MSDYAKLTLLAALVAILALLTLFRGCGYGEVGPSAYEHAKALYSICNRQDADRLTVFSASLSQAREAGEVTAREQEWLEDIVALAQAGDWQQAAANARRLMEDQIQGGP